MHQYVYFNRSKIDNLYAQIVDRVETEHHTLSTTEIAGKGNIETGTLAKLLAGKLNGELSGKYAKETDINSKLEAENKLQHIDNHLKNSNEYRYFDKYGLLIGNTGKFVSFPAQFKVVNTPEFDKPADQLEIFEIDGIFSDFTIKLIVAKKAFIEPLWYNKLLMVSKFGYLPLRVFGTLIALNEEKKIGFVDPITINYESVSSGCG